MRLYKGEWAWDIRIHPAIIHWRAECLRLRIPYYWKLNKQEAQDLCDLLAEEYNVSSPIVRNFHEDHMGQMALKVDGAKAGLNGCYFASQCVIYIHASAHIKTVVHEFYHHLDCVTEGQYDSDDHPDGSGGRTTKVSLAWQFAARWWEQLTGQKEKYK